MKELIKSGCYAKSSSFTKFLVFNGLKGIRKLTVMLLRMLEGFIRISKSYIIHIKNYKPIIVTHILICYS